MINHLLAAAILSFAANDSVKTLRDVTVSSQLSSDVEMRSSQSAVQVSSKFITQNFSGSLMQTLEALPGVKAMSIGSGQSKPIIRGLGFNRLAVTEDGIKHEGQQWGDDHGLEIDQFAIDRAEVIKGPAALLYGSDAIGGVLNLYTNHLPTEPFEGKVQLLGRSNNEQLGISAKVGGRTGNFFYRANVTLIDYADYRVPTDSIQYYSYYIRLKDRRLRNTAGLERDGSIMLGYAGYNFHTDVRISDSYAKSGFFANAHGLEVRLSDIDYDRSRRDVDLPYQWVNHLKVISHTSWRNEVASVEAKLAYQNNLRQEHSEPIAHGYMPQPDGTLERRFNKNTFTANLTARYSLGQHELQAGINGEYQYNRRGGWGFIIPEFNSSNFGVFTFDRYNLRENLIFNAGVRFDASQTNISEYQDWYRTPTANGDTVYAQRSANMHRHFHSLTYSAGINYTFGNWIVKANIGKSFRVPIPKELGADGINYHIFRYERGNTQLDPEESYQIDAAIIWKTDRMQVQVEPYLNYFPNYIYLNPTAQYVEGLQLYNYQQARVMRYGFEAQAKYKVNKHWELGVQGEYLYARQRSGQKKGYTLPFSTPWSADADVKYILNINGDGYVKINAHVVGVQNEIVPPEKPTDGYWTLNLAAGKDFKLQKQTFHMALNANNLLNRRYYDHTSYYRLIDVPEPGRNFSVIIGMDF